MAGGIERKLLREKLKQQQLATAANAIVLGGESGIQDDMQAMLKNALAMRGLGLQERQLGMGERDFDLRERQLAQDEAKQRMANLVSLAQAGGYGGGDNSAVVNAILKRLGVTAEIQPPQVTTPMLPQLAPQEPRQTPEQLQLQQKLLETLNNQ